MRAFSALCLAAVVAMGCSPNGASGGPDRPVAEAGSGAAEAPRCAAFSELDGPVPRVSAEQLTLEYWLRQIGSRVDLDEVLLDNKAIATLNASAPVPRDDYHPQRDLAAPIDIERLSQEVLDRRTWARDKLTKRELVDAKGAGLGPTELAILEQDVPLGSVTPELRVVLADTVIHCAPMLDSFYAPALDLRLDRNACSVLRAQDVVRVIAVWPNGMKLVEAPYSYGWVPADTPLSPVVPQKLVTAFVHGPSVQVVGSELSVGDGAAPVHVSVGTRLAALDKQGKRAHVATAQGFVTTAAKDAALLRSTRRPLTRRALLEEAWRFIGTPYGLGDTRGGRDCSRLLLDVFESFNLHLPRHSSWQSRAGSFWIDTERVKVADRAMLIDAAAQKGVVFLQFPGHIMLYLGRNEAGQPMVLHALGEYAERCPGSAPAETLVRVKNITVSDLELGKGTSRTSLLERITRITVIGKPPGVELAGVAQMRPAAVAPVPSDRRCQDSENAAIYTLPEQPNPTQPLRFVSATSEDPGAAELILVGPDGKRVTPAVVRLGGPPYGQVATVENPKRGRWKAFLADGDNLVACHSVQVVARRPKPNEPDAGPVWLPKRKWNVANENLYALFVERLFDYELAEDRVWTNLHTLLRDRDRNILFDYRGLDEDSRLELRPDCADLPYALRSYFAWKMRLPFGYRRCTRGRVGRPPHCDEPGASDNLMSRLELPGKGGRLLPRDDVEAYELFINTQLATAVHSSSGRTSPEDDLTDFYPVALSRKALKPGTVFADPYGHFLVLADWIPQGPDGYGILVGADAQPDGTIGQRRFWRGTFLFDPDTRSGGAGFKAFRPRAFVQQPVNVDITVDARSAENGAKWLVPTGASELPAADKAVFATPPVGEPPRQGASDGKQLVSIPHVGTLDQVNNDDLRRSAKFNRLSLQQYQGSADDFYATVEALINPRPLAPSTMQGALIDALFEAVTRRVVSVANGEKWAAEHPGEVVSMPEGDGIFLAAGPWEDFSTPSRDLRLLIAIDTVRGFADSVRQHPERYGLAAAEVNAKADAVAADLSSQLSQRTFEYVRSDGSTQRLSLLDVLNRAAGFEVAYNPNDCAELRWGAAEGSKEASTCKRRAPDDQRAKMASYRGWFSTRQRPPQ
ncbi:MAG TPA: NlpC/P60 family protein [Polyangiaceae bacterium]|nr:NlpC/P60 family protein [Polyangiaceae bacterium]